MLKKVLLINPAINPASQHAVINKVISKAIPTSLGVLAAALIDAQAAWPEIIDEQIDRLNGADIEKAVLSLERPRIIGMSVLTVNSKRAYDLCARIKEIDSDALIVLGGIHPSVVPDEALGRQGVDVVVRGEGEETFRELVESVFTGKDYNGIQGISYRNNGKIVHNPSRPITDDLDRIPSFPYFLFKKNLQKYSTFGAVFTSRGCPYNCIFCSSRSISGKAYRYFSTDRVVSEIKLLADEYKQKLIFIMDDNIAGNRAHFTGLLGAIIKNGLHNKTAFQGSVRADNIDRELIALAKAANFRMLSFGLETGSETLMKMINKGETVKQVAQAITLTDDYGIAAAATVIFGLPTEKRKDRWDAIRLVKKLPLSSVRFNTLVPYPGTPVFDMLNREGRVKIKKDWENFAVQYMWEGDTIPYVPEGSSGYELMFDTMYANLSYYLSVKGIRRMMKSSFAGGNVIKLQDAWYLSPKTVYRLIRVFLYLARRFLFVSYKMILEKNRLGS